MAISDPALPNLVIDCVLFQIIDGQLTVLIGKVAREPYYGEWALPGSSCAVGEIADDAIRRIMREKAGIDTSRLGLMEQFYTFDSIGKNGSHVFHVVYLGIGHGVQLNTDNKVSAPYFAPIVELPPLAYGQRAFVDHAVNYLRSKLIHTTLAASMLPDFFTLTELQKFYELVLGRPLDKRNFRKKFISYDVLEATEEFTQGGAHRPSQLYRFKSKKLVQFAEDFS